MERLSSINVRPRLKAGASSVSLRQYQRFSGEFRGFSSDADPILPPPSRRGLWATLAAGVIGFGALFGGLFKYTEPNRDPIRINGAHFNPNHQDRPDLMVTRVYPLKNTERKAEVCLILDIEPKPPEHDVFKDYNFSEDFEQAAKIQMRRFHYYQLKPKVEAFVASVARRFGPEFSREQFEQALHTSWTNDKGITQDPLSRSILGTMTMQGRPYTIKLIKADAFTFHEAPLPR